MKRIPLRIKITEEHPAHQWAKSQSDFVNVIGHIGTPLDCSMAEPTNDTYEIDAVVFDCTETMPIAKQFEKADLYGKAAVLYTGVLDFVGYGSSTYGKSDPFPDTRVIRSSADQIACVYSNRRLRYWEL